MTAIPETAASAATHAGPRARRPEIDFLRGLILMLMVVYHNFRVATSADPFQLFLMGVLELLSGIFLVVSGVNVSNFIESAKRDPNFEPTKFYLKASFWLFVMGYSYNLLVGTPFVMDLIQLIAAGTFVTYLLLRYKVSNALVGLVTLGFFACGLVAFGRAVTLPPDVQTRFLFHQLIGSGAVTKDHIQTLVPTPYLFNHFGPIPWVGFFTLGIFLDRLKGRALWLVSAAAVMMMIAGAFLPTLQASEDVLLGFRTNPRYIFQGVGFNALLFLLTKAYFRGKSGDVRIVAFWSEVSLIVFVFHWLFIMAASAVIAAGARVSNFYFFHDGFRYTRAVLSFLGTAWALRPLENLRVRLSKSPKFESRVKILMAAGFALAIVTAFVAGKTPVGSSLAFLGCVTAACSFAFAYPKLRAGWRREAIRR